MMKSPLWLALVLVLVMAAIPPLLVDARNAFLAAPTAQSNVPAAKTDTPTATPTASKTPTATPSRTPTAGATRTATAVSTASATPTTVASPTTPASATPTLAVSATPTAPAGAIAPGNFNSTVLIANLDSVQASARLRVFSPSGAEVYNTTRTIAANGLLSVGLPASLGDGFVGSATVSSSQKIYALVLNANPSNGAREIYETSKTPQTSLSFGIFRHLGNSAQKSVIAVRNTNPSSAASVTFHYYAANGAEAAGSPLPTVTIPANGSYSYDSQTLFGSAVVSYTVRVDSDVSIAATERVEFLKDTAALSALTTADTGTDAYLNWVERGISAGSRPDSWSEIYVRNGGSAQTTVTVTYYNPNGSIQDSQSQSVAPNGFALFDTRADSALGSAFSGYARVTQSGSQPLAVQWLEAESQGTALAGFSGLPASRSAAKWTCTDARRQDVVPPQYTTFQIVNVDTAPATLSINLYDPLSGALLTAVPKTLAAGNQLNVNLKSNDFNAAGGSYSGLALIQSTNSKRLVVSASSTYDGLGQTGYACVTLP